MIARFIASKSWEKKKQHIVNIEKMDNKEKKNLNILTDNLQIEVKQLIDKGNKSFSKGKISNALLTYNKAIELDPTNEEAYGKRAFIYLFAIVTKTDIEFKDKAGQAAIEDYTKLIELNPQDYISYHNRAFVLLKLTRYQEAINDDTKAIELNPEHGEAFWTRSQAYEALGKPQQAVTDIKEAAKLGYEDAQKYLKEKIVSN